MLHDTQISLAHGGGGQESQSLIHELFMHYFGNEILLASQDAATLDIDSPIAFTTDSFTVSPLFFSGADIGTLAITGTVNDLAMVGAMPRYLSVAFIIEEGLPIDTLKRVVQSMAEVLSTTNAKIVCGDTKVMPKGSIDKLVINTSGIGTILKPNIKSSALSKGDSIIVSGSIARHGATILSARESLKATSSIQSDCKLLHEAVRLLIDENIQIKAMRDATRGGIAAVLNEWAQEAACCIEINQEAIPIDDNVQGLCEIYGFDAMHLANEGTFILAVAPQDEARALALLESLDFAPKGIGSVSMKKPSRVILHTPYGSARYLELPKGELLPRIC